MTVTYLKDVSVLLTLASSVSEANIEKHLQAEQKMIDLAFAFDHPNYAHYASYQNVYLSSLKQAGHPAYDDMLKRGYGASITGDKFSTLSGDLITKLFNKETKGTSGPFRADFSTDIQSVNTWVQTIHIHSTLRKALHTALYTKTSSKHKEVTNSGKKLHRQHVNSLKKELVVYGVHPFSDVTGVAIDKEVAGDMLRAMSVGEKQADDFVKERLAIGETSLFSPIKKNKLKTEVKGSKRK